MHWRCSKYLSFSAGPSLVICYSDHKDLVNGHPYTFPHKGYPGFTLSDTFTGWIGWHIGLSFF
ncbi:MAG TPA: hypothetical protein VK563_01100 [Puia sp.]|nr:hypothetical protein [Puia sp.]